MWVLSAERVTRVLDRVVAWRGYPSKLRMDNGPEFISNTLADWAEEQAIDLEFIQPGKPMQNSYVERFNRTFRDEILNIYVFKTLSEVRAITEGGWTNTTKSVLMMHSMTSRHLNIGWLINRWKTLL